YRKARGAAFGIGAGQRSGIEVLSDQSFARRCSLDFGNEAIASLRHRPPQRRDETARRRRRTCRRFELGAAASRLGAGDLVSLAGADAREHVVVGAACAHAVWPVVISTMCRSAACALPRSIDCPASSIPWRSSAALPATSNAAPALSSTTSRIGPL